MNPPLLKGRTDDQKRQISEAANFLLSNPNPDVLFQTLTGVSTLENEVQSAVYLETVAVSVIQRIEHHSTLYRYNDRHHFSSLEHCESSRSKVHFGARACPMFCTPRPTEPNPSSMYLIDTPLILWSWSIQGKAWHWAQKV